MTRHTQAHPNTSPGTSETSTKEIENNEGWGEDVEILNVSGPSRQDINRFHEKVALAKEMSIGKEMPEIEVPRRIIEHYNRNSINGFDEAGYFVFQGVKVFEVGKRTAMAAKDKLTMEQKLHGGA